MIAFPSSLHGDSVPSVGGQERPTEGCVRRFEQESNRIMAMRELCGCEFTESFATTTEPCKEITGTTARTTWTCAVAQYVAVAATLPGGRSPCDGYGAATCAKLEDLLQAQAPCADMAGEQVLRASTKLALGSQLHVTDLRHDGWRCCRSSDCTHARRLCTDERYPHQDLPGPYQVPTADPYMMHRCLPSTSQM